MAEVLIVVAIVVFGAGVVAGVVFIASVSVRREEQKERSRLRGEVLGVTASEGTRVITSLSPGRTRPGSDNKTESAKQQVEPGDVEDDEVPSELPTVENGENNARFAVLLIDYYAYGLTQARRSFIVSLVFSIIGGLVLVSGVALAIFRASTNGQQYAAIVTSIAGILTSSIGVLFHREAARALKHMEEQTNKLRQDMKAEREVSAALEILAEVTDSPLRSRLQAALVLKFTSAKLPDIGPLTQQVPGLGTNPDGKLEHPSELGRPDNTLK